ncbi:MAG TPA: sigma-54 dependent transcriptional regulator [Stellaceae bacterium]|jgi:two-component system nitrogen regulation response regulator NtrX|nr:sigma-54 dependent transcriptional regulator [Stellaceae bacterium]
MAHDILVIDDEADIRMLICGVLEDEGYETRQAADSTEALAAIRSRLPSLLVLDIWLQGSELDGIEILRIARAEAPNLAVVMISGHGTIETAVAAIKMGAYDFIEKPFKSDRLLLVVERAIQAARLRRENEELRLRAGGDEELVGNSHAVAQLRQQVEKAAPTKSRVMISGAPGSGKEVVARLLHRRSRRAEAPFVVLNCAMLRPDHLEIELFGAAAGAEGPDSPRKIGLFEEAHSGTLFLDEVADMPLETQGKIVRGLQEQTFERLGGTRVEVDVRVMASTNRDLAAEVAAGRFREDLYYRLAVVPIRVPALRERREDIPMLARHFMRRAAEAARLMAREIGDDAMAALQSYDWPGNARQLRNVIDWLLIMAPGDVREPVRAEMLPAEIGSDAPAVVRWDKGGEIMSLPLRDAREVFEREYLIAQVTRFGGNISRTAAFIGMERSALHRKLKTLGLFNGERIVKVES